MTEYVLVYPRLVGETHEKTFSIINQLSHQTLLVLKNKPAWQRGRLNLLGGKVEPGETPQEAAVRELFEESGLAGDNPDVLGKIYGVDCVIWCISVRVYNSELSPRSEETELVQWYSWNEVKDDPRLIPNLRVIIPLMRMNVFGWMIDDKDSSIGKGSHRIAVELDIKTPFING